MAAFRLPLVAIASAIALATGSAIAQGRDEQAPVPVLHVVGAEDGLPRPGVLLRRFARTEEPRRTADGLLVAEPYATTRLRRATWTGRTDPEGKIVLAGFDPVEVPMISVCEPHWANHRPQREGDVWKVRVHEHEPIGVVVVDGSGARLQDFAVDLLGDTQVLSSAISDSAGRAMLSIQKGYTARVVVAPSGWIGSLDAFPTVAEALPGKRGAKLTLPGRGVVRVRFQRGGQPASLLMTHVNLRAFDGYPVTATPPTFPQTECTGFELPLVALGTPFRLTSSSRDRWSLDVDALERDGQVAEYVVELGPKLSLRLDGVDLPKQAIVRVRVVTDAGAIAEEALGSSNEPFVFECSRTLPGKCVQRIEVDVRSAESGGGKSWIFGGTASVDLGLPMANLDFGKIEVAAQPDQLRGRVVDANGAPVAGAHVVVMTAGPDGGTLTLTADENGTFATSTPPARDAKGQRAGTRVVARHAGWVSAQTDEIPFGSIVELRLDRQEKTKPVATGSLTLVVADADAVAVAHRRLALLGKRGFPRYEPVRSTQKGKDHEVVFEGIAEGEYSLVASDTNVGPMVALDAIRSDGVGACDDPRLKEPMRLEERLRTVEIVVVDQEGIPIVGARVVGTYMSRPTDGTGTVRVPWNSESKGHLTVEKPGMRPVRIHEVRDRHVVTLLPPGKVEVAVAGIPADCQRQHVVVWVRSAERGSFEGNQAALGEGDVAKVDLPLPGSYRAVLLVQTRNSSGELRGTSIAQTEPFAIGDHGADPQEIRLDEEAVQRLRDAVEKAAGGR